MAESRDTNEVAAKIEEHESLIPAKILAGHLGVSPSPFTAGSSRARPPSSA